MNEFHTDKKTLFFIVFLIDSKYKDHDGMVFRSLPAARQFCRGVIEDKYADKIIIGQFLPNSSESFLISMVETFGFKNDKKQLQQLDLFKSFNL